MEQDRTGSSSEGLCPELEKNWRIHVNYSFLGECSSRDERHNNFQSEISQSTARDRGDRCKHEALRKQLLDEASAGGTQRGAHGHFLFSRGRTSQQKVRNIATSDQEQKQDSGEQAVQRFLEPSDKTVEKSLRHNRELFWEWEWSAWIRLLVAVRNGIEIGSCGLYAHSLLKASHNRTVAPPVSHWQPEVRPKGVEPLRHDSDQSRRLAVEDENSVENLWIAAEFRLPKVVVHNEHRRSIRTAIFLREGAPEERRNA